MGSKIVKCDKCKKEFDNTENVGHIVKRLGCDGAEIWCPACASMQATAYVCCDVCPVLLFWVI